MNSSSNLVFTLLLVTMMVFEKSVWHLGRILVCFFSLTIWLTCILAHSNEMCRQHCTGQCVRKCEQEVYQKAENKTGSNVFSRLFSFVSPSNRSVLFIHINLYLYLSILAFMDGFWTLHFTFYITRTSQIRHQRYLLNRWTQIEYVKPLRWA